MKLSSNIIDVQYINRKVLLVLTQESLIEIDINNDYKSRVLINK